MDTVVIEAPTSSDVLFMPNFRHNGALAMSTSAKVLDDDFFISLIEEIHEGKPPSATRNEVLNAIKSGKVSPDIVEELEDAILGAMMEEARNSESVSLEEIMEVLSQ